MKKKIVHFELDCATPLMAQYRAVNPDNRFLIRTFCLHRSVFNPKPPAEKLTLTIQETEE